MGGGKRLDGIISGDDRLRHSGYTVHAYHSLTLRWLTDIASD
jgi:hypothetical protein